MITKEGVRKRAEIVPWRPFTELEELERRFDRLFREPFPSFFERLPREMEWMPNVDVFEKDNKLIVKADIPGMKQEDIILLPIKGSL